MRPPGEEESDEERTAVEKENNPSDAPGKAVAAGEDNDTRQPPLSESAGRKNVGKAASKAGGGKGKGKATTGAKKPAAAAAAAGIAAVEDPIAGKIKAGSRKAKVRAL